MNNRTSEVPTIECRVVVIDPGSKRVVVKPEIRPLSLLRESIPAYGRMAADLTGALFRLYGFTTIQLAVLPRKGCTSYCAVHELICVRRELSTSLSLADLDEVDIGELNPEERDFVGHIISGRLTSHGRFARLGWVRELLVEAGYGRDSSDWPRIQHVNQGVDFCLLSLTTSDAGIKWFKAVGQPNEHEYALTLELSHRFPQFLPKVSLKMPEWNGWISEDASGLPLTQSSSQTDWKNALSALACMQKSMVGQSDALYTLGATDWSCERIDSLLAGFFEASEQAMLAQTSTNVAVLRVEELQILRSNLEMALRRLNDGGLPMTLIHGDVGHGNVLLSTTGPIFLDWAETYIGHPFLCAEYLLRDFERRFPDCLDEMNDLRYFYAERWKGCVRSAAISIASTLAPAIAAIAYAVIAWDASTRQPDATTVWPLLRTLLRRSKRELDLVPELAS